LFPRLDSTQNDIKKRGGGREQGSRGFDPGRLLFIGQKSLADAGHQRAKSAFYFSVAGMRATDRESLPADVAAWLLSRRLRNDLAISCLIARIQGAFCMSY
jgi:hypothetical protein